MGFGGQKNWGTTGKIFFGFQVAGFRGLITPRWCGKSVKTFQKIAQTRFAQTVSNF